MKEKDKTPIAYVKKRKHGRGLSDLITILCPYCNREHLHGVPRDMKGRLGNRIAHCVSMNSSTYNIIEKE